MKFTQQQLENAFSKISNPKDWKGRINAIVHNTDVEVTTAAIIHFTATKPTITVGGFSGVFSVLQSPGYRMGPAGP